jgi:hypothetical protein
VQGAARPVCVVGRATVPQMTVEYDARPCASEEQDLLGMRVGWIRHDVAGLPSPAVRTGHHPGGPVGFCERVEQPCRRGSPGERCPSPHTLRCQPGRLLTRRVRRSEPGATPGRPHKQRKVEAHSGGGEPHSQYSAGVAVWLRLPGVVQVRVPGWWQVTVQPGACLVWWSWRQAGPTLQKHICGWRHIRPDQREHPR